MIRIVTLLALSSLFLASCSAGGGGGGQPVVDGTPSQQDQTPPNLPPTPSKDKITSDQIFALAEKGSLREISDALSPFNVTMPYLKQLLTSKNANGDTPLMAAIRAKNSSAIDEFINYDFSSPFQKTREGKTPRQLAEDNGLDNFKDRLLRKELIWAEELFIAIDGSDLSRVKYIIETLDAPPDLHPDPDGIVRYQQTNDRNANPEWKTVRRTIETPVRYLAQRTEPLTSNQVQIADYLLSKGADPEPHYYRTQWNIGAIPDMSPMALAALHSQSALIAVLAKHGGKVDGPPEPYYYSSGGRRVTDYLYPPMYEAIYSVNGLNNPAGEATVKALLDAGADPNLKRGDAPYALDFAAKVKNCNIIKLLLNAGAITTVVTDPEKLQLIRDCQK